MKFNFSVEAATFLARPNRFLVLARLAATGDEVRVHCPDPGRLTELLLPGATLYVSPASGAGRKTSHVLRFVEHPDPDVHGQLVSLDTQLPNAVFAEGIATGFFAPFEGYSIESREVPIPAEIAGKNVRSRIDFLLAHPKLSSAWVEVKSVTLVENRRARFPDAVTARGARHVLELAHLHAATGLRTAVVFIVQRPDADSFSPYSERDPVFAAALREATATGVEIYAYRCRLSLGEISLDAPIAVCLMPESDCRRRENGSKHG